MKYKWTLGVKYDPSQPRVPAGDPQGGQWTNGLIASFYPREKKMLETALAFIPPEHIRGLKEITAKAPSGYKYDSMGHMVNKQGERILGVYKKSGPSIHLSAVAFYTEDQLIATVAHEIGHHVTRGMIQLKESAGYFSHELSYLSDQELAEAGLRRNSTYSGGELLADAYRTWLFGSMKQWEMLEETTGLNLKSVFGKKREV